MFDGFKSKHNYLLPESWLNKACLQFPLSVDERTGEVLEGTRVATLNGLIFKITPGGTGRHYLNLSGSLHKFFNGGQHNANDYSIADVHDTLTQLAAEYDIRPELAVLESLEFGVNVQLPFDPNKVLRAIICHNEKAFEQINHERKGLGFICCRHDYTLKVYNKGQQANADASNLLRIELRINKMRFLQPFGISSLADLADPKSVSLLAAKFQGLLSEVLIYDNSINAKNLTEAKRYKLAQYSNPKYWENLSRVQRHRQKMQFENLIAEHSETNLKAVVLEIVQTKISELLTDKHKNCIRIHPDLIPPEKQEMYTLSPLECRVKSLQSIEEEKKGKNCKDNFQARTCKSCNSDISMQSPKAVFCSAKHKGAKAAKACRNKDSNHRRNIKAKIMKAKTDNSFLLITYRHEGQIYSDLLGANEIAVTRDWLDKVLKVEVQPRHPMPTPTPPPETLEGQAAKDYLQTLNQSGKPDATA
ncbi:MAG: hypothetical protein V4543_12340 [Bacteroidota bacterium]